MPQLFVRYFIAFLGQPCPNYAQRDYAPTMPQLYLLPQLCPEFCPNYVSADYRFANFVFGFIGMLDVNAHRPCLQEHWPYVRSKTGHQECRNRNTPAQVMDPGAVDTISVAENWLKIKNFNYEFKLSFFMQRQFLIKVGTGVGTKKESVSMRLRS